MLGPVQCQIIIPSDIDSALASGKGGGGGGGGEGHCILSSLQNVAPLSFNLGEK